MKKYSPAHVGCKGAISTFVIALSLFCTPAFCQGEKVTLLVQQSPDNGGAVTPASGAYKYDQDSEVTLTATPSAGYKFLYWLGDVSDKESTSTVVHLDKTKIVIAIFERVGDTINVSNHSGGGGSSGGLASSPAYISQGGGISGGGGKSQKPIVYAPSGDKTPVIPEPATGLLLVLGSLFTFTKRRRRQINPSQN